MTWPNARRSHEVAERVHLHVEETWRCGIVPPREVPLATHRTDPDLRLRAVRAGLGRRAGCSPVRTRSRVPGGPRTAPRKPARRRGVPVRRRLEDAAHLRVARRAPGEIGRVFVEEHHLHAVARNGGFQHRRWRANGDLAVSRLRKDALRKRRPPGRGRWKAGARARALLRSLDLLRRGGRRRRAPLGLERRADGRLAERYAQGFRPRAVRLTARPRL